VTASSPFFAIRIIWPCHLALSRKVCYSQAATLNCHQTFTLRACAVRLGAIFNDPVSTEVNTGGALEKDINVPVKLMDGEEVR